MLLPYDRGDLVSRVHDDGEVLAQEHRAEGTRLRAQVSARLAGELSAYRQPEGPSRGVRDCSDRVIFAPGIRAKKSLRTSSPGPRA